MPGVAWVVDPRGNVGMTVTDPESLKRLRRDELSASTSFALDPSNCAVGMVASRLLPREDNLFEANQLGTAAHAVLECLFGMEGPLRTKEEALAITRRLHTDTAFALTLVDADLSQQIADLDGADLERWLYEVDRRVLGLWEIEDPTQVVVHSTEMQFGKKFGRVVKIGRVPFVGFIDRVDAILDLNTGEIVGFRVKDYKAGKVKQADRFGDDYGDQIRIYRKAVKEAEGIVPDGGSLLFITYGVERIIETDDNSVAVTVARFERAWDRMHDLADKNLYPTKDGPLCSWCPLVNSCPSAAKNNRKDLSDTEKVSGKRIAVEGKEKKGLDRVALGIPVVGKPATSGALGTAPVIELKPARARVAEVAAHRPDEPKEEKTTMTVSATAQVKEGMNRKDAFVDDSLNGNSFAAIAVFGITERAVTELSKAGQPVDALHVHALTQTYVSVVQAVQFALSGSSSYSDGLNCRVRGALYASLETVPAPWGEGQSEWTAWVEKITKRTRAISSVAIATIGLGADLPDTPWAALATA